MELNEAQIWLLDKIESGEVPQVSDFNGLLDEESQEDRVKELAFYIKQLEEAGLLKIGKGTFAEGGRKHPKYDNNVRIIWFDRLLISPKGIRLIRGGDY